MDPVAEGKNTFSVIKRIRSFAHAGRGVWVFLRTTHNAWIQLLVLGVAVGMGVYYGIGREDWMLLIFASGLVLASEAFNRAIEIDIDLTSPEYHPYARDTKDVAAAAVLIASAAAALVGIFIFGHYLFGW